MLARGDVNNYRLATFRRGRNFVGDFLKHGNQKFIRDEGDSYEVPMPCLR
jgi:hypothetical protein